MQPTTEIHEDKSEESLPIKSVSEEHWEKIPHVSVTEKQANKLVHLSVAEKQGDEFVHVSAEEDQDYDYDYVFAPEEKHDELSHFDILESVLDSVSEKPKEKYRQLSELQLQSENSIDMDTSKLSSLRQPTAQHGKEQSTSEVRSEL